MYIRMGSAEFALKHLQISLVLETRYVPCPVWLYLFVAVLEA